MAKQMNLVKAILTVYDQGGKETCSKTSNAQGRRALVRLGLEGEDLLMVGTRMNLWGRTGNAYLPGSPNADGSIKEES